MRLNVTKQRSIWWAVSVTVILIGTIAMGISWATLGAPLRPGLDFAGGTRLQLELDCSVPGNCDRQIQPGNVRDVATEQGLSNSSIQVLGEDRHAFSVRTKALSPEERAQLQSALQQAIGTFDPQKTQIDTVGPVVGRQLFLSGLISLTLSMFGIIGYLTLRFQFDYAFFAIVALFHDILVTAGAFSVLGLTQGLEVDSLFLVALLTIIGFSVNDTVVIYDRVREKIAEQPEADINQQIDAAVNETLGRSINTTLTTLLSVVAIFLFGGETLKSFSLALIIGFICGAYSSIFIASSLLGWWRQRQPAPLALSDPQQTPTDE